jgi:hypothetical protein
VTSAADTGVARPQARFLSLVGRYARAMIDLGSIAGLHERQHEVHCYCARCERWRVLDLQRLIDIGRGETRLPLRVRCLRCRGRGEVQIRPPMPRHSTASGWVMPALVQVSPAVSSE